MGTGQATRVDRIWTDELTLQRLVSAKTHDDFGAPGHRAIMADFLMNTLYTREEVPAPPLQQHDWDPGERQLQIGRITQGWRALKATSMDVDVLHRWWSMSWEAFLIGPHCAPGDLRRHVISKGEERARACMDNAPPLRVRRLRNYLTKLKGVKRAWERGESAGRLWREVQTASLYMATRFGTPVLGEDTAAQGEVVGAILARTIDFYEAAVNLCEVGGKKEKGGGKAEVPTGTSRQWRSQ